MSRARTKGGGSVSCAWSLGEGPREKWRIFWWLTKPVRVRLGLAKHRPERVFTLKTRYGALSFRDNATDIAGLHAFLCRGACRWREVEGPGMIVDAGAGIGLAGAWFTHYNPEKPAWCFVGDSADAALVRRNCWRARVVETAFGEADAPPVRALDGCADEYGWGVVALLRVASGGAEAGILRGGRRLLARSARVIVETSGEDGHTEVLALLGDAGFEIEDESRGGGRGVVFAVRKPPTG